MSDPPRTSPRTTQKRRRGHRVSAAGSYRIDRTFPGVGRIAVASGALTLTDFKKRNDLLTSLFSKGRLELLRAIQQHTYTVTEVYAADLEDRLDALSGDRAILAKPLWSTVKGWIGENPGPTRKRYGVSWNAMRARSGLAESATIESLATVDWHALKNRWPASDADWFQVRATVSAFLASQLGDVQHPFRRKVVKAIPRANARERVPDLDVSAFWRIVNQTPEYVRPAYVAIAVLGLRVGEYLRLKDTDLLPMTKQVRIPGTKTASSAVPLPVAEALWPWITRAVPAPLHYKWLRLYWTRACLATGAATMVPDTRRLDASGKPKQRYEGARLHDLRHLTAMMLVNAGRPEASVQHTMRHATAAMTRRYAMQRDRGENAEALANALLQVEETAPAPVAQSAG
jgi:integrase